MHANTHTTGARRSEHTRAAARITHTRRGKPYTTYTQHTTYAFTAHTTLGVQSGAW